MDEIINSLNPEILNNKINNMDVKEYLTTYFLPYIKDSKTIPLRNGVDIPIKQYIEELLIPTLPNYSNNIQATIANTTALDPTIFPSIAMKNSNEFDGDELIVEENLIYKGKEVRRMVYHKDAVCKSISYKDGSGAIEYSYEYAENTLNGMNFELRLKFGNTIIALACADTLRKKKQLDTLANDLDDVLKLIKSPEECDKIIENYQKFIATGGLATTALPPQIERVNQKKKELQEELELSAEKNDKKNNDIVEDLIEDCKRTLLLGYDAIDKWNKEYKIDMDELDYYERRITDLLSNISDYARLIDRSTYEYYANQMSSLLTKYWDLQKNGLGVESPNLEEFKDMWKEYMYMIDEFESTRRNGIDPDSVTEIIRMGRKVNDKLDEIQKYISRDEYFKTQQKIEEYNYEYKKLSYQLEEISSMGRRL